MTAQSQASATDVIRALSAAAAAARLYPDSSDIPRQARERFAELARAQAASDGAPVRFVVEPGGFKSADGTVISNPAQVLVLAETLYAHQIGLLAIGSSVTAEETATFLRIVQTDAATVRHEGGIRAAIVAAGVTDIAVIALTVRTSTGEIASSDLLTDDAATVGAAAIRSAADWARSATGGDGRDGVAQIVDGLEPGEAEAAYENIAEALLRVDERTRAAIMAAAVRRDTNGKDMRGMLTAIAHLSPASLARLLTISAERTGEAPLDAALSLELPPEALHALSLLLRPSPRSEADSGVPADVRADDLAAEMLGSESDEELLTRSMDTLGQVSASSRALETTMRLAEETPDLASIEAVVASLGKAVEAGAFEPAGRALQLLERMTPEPGCETALELGRGAITVDGIIAHGLATAPELDARATAAVLAGAGIVGSEAFIDAWLSAAPARKTVLEAVGRITSDQMLAAAGRRTRTATLEHARDLTALVGRLGNRRAIPWLSQMLRNSSQDARFAAVDALAALDTEDAWSCVYSMLEHPDEDSALHALSAVRANGAPLPLEMLHAGLGPRGTAQRRRRLQREIVETLGDAGDVAALPALRRLATPWLRLGREARGLRHAARQATARIEASRDVLRTVSG